MRAHLKHMTTFKVMDVLERAQELEKQGVDIVHMEVGEPDFDTPSEVVIALREAVERGETRYTHSLGIQELREEIARHYATTYSVHVDPECVVVTPGTSPAMLLAFGCLLNENEEVIITDPGYPCYHNFVRFLGGKIRRVPLREDEGYIPNPSLLKKHITPRTRAIIINSPANPTGAVIPEDVLKEICNLGPTIISDEIYHGLNYGTEVTSALCFSEDAFVVNGFSKAYAMTGWRLGYLIVPRPYLDAVQKMQQNFFISTNAFVQHAGIVALREGKNFVEKVKHEYMKRRDIMYEELINTGFEVRYRPSGAFYFLVNVKKLFPRSLEGAFELLEKAHVAVTPGVDFGEVSEGHLRFSYSVSEDKIKEGFKRIRKYLQER